MAELERQAAEEAGNHAGAPESPRHPPAPESDYSDTPRAHEEERRLRKGDVVEILSDGGCGRRQDALGKYGVVEADDGSDQPYYVKVGSVKSYYRKEWVRLHQEAAKTSKSKGILETEVAKANGHIEADIKVGQDAVSGKKPKAFDVHSLVVGDCVTVAETLPSHFGLKKTKVKKGAVGEVEEKFRNGEVLFRWNTEDYHRGLVMPEDFCKLVLHEDTEASRLHAAAAKAAKDKKHQDELNYSGKQAKSNHSIVMQFNNAEEVSNIQRQIDQYMAHHGIPHSVIVDDSFNAVLTSKAGETIDCDELPTRFPHGLPDDIFPNAVTCTFRTKATATPPKPDKPYVKDESGVLQVSWTLPQLDARVEFTTVRVKQVGAKDWQFLDCGSGKLVAKGGKAVAAPKCSVQLCVPTGTYEVAVRQRNIAGWSEISSSSALCAVEVMSCMIRRPYAGELVRTKDGNKLTAHEWKLEAGEQATVEEVDKHHDFRLSNPHGEVSAWMYRDKFVYVHEAEFISLDFDPGPIGFRVKNDTGKITSVTDGGQAHRGGVEVGMVVQTVHGVEYSVGALQNASKHGVKYEVIFHKNLQVEYPDITYGAEVPDSLEAMNEKKLKKLRKEGGKRGVEIVKAASLGGLQIFLHKLGHTKWRCAPSVREPESHECREHSFSECSS
jgi:hypothetical protein